MTAICANCGLSVEPDEPVERDGWWISAFGQVLYNNERVQLRPAGAGLLYAVAATRGPINRVALLARISETESDNLFSVQLSHLRRALRDHGLPVPFVTLWGTGKIMWLADDQPQPAICRQEPAI